MHTAPIGFYRCRECNALFPHTKTGRKPQWCPDHRAKGAESAARSQKRSDVRHRYGVELEVYEERMADAKCALCDTTENLVYDHDHKTGAFRGVLCRQHNAAIGQLGDDAQSLWDAFAYIVGVPTRPDWNAYAMILAQAVAGRSDCIRAHVGAVIVRPDHTIAGTGYVGVPAGEPGCLSGSCPRGRKSLSDQPRGGSYNDCISTHAEANALRVTPDPRGCTAYVTREPCASCHSLLKDAGIRMVFWPQGFKNYEDR